LRSIQGAPGPADPPRSRNRDGEIAPACAAEDERPTAREARGNTATARRGKGVGGMVRPFVSRTGAVEESPYGVRRRIMTGVRPKRDCLLRGPKAAAGAHKVARQVPRKTQALPKGGHAARCEADENRRPPVTKTLSIRVPCPRFLAQSYLEASAPESVFRGVQDRRFASPLVGDMQSGTPKSGQNVINPTKYFTKSPPDPTSFGTPRIGLSSSMLARKRAQGLRHGTRRRLCGISSPVGAGFHRLAICVMRCLRREGKPRPCAG